MRQLLAILFCMPLAARPVSLVWDAAPAAEQVVGWRVWRGIEQIGASNTPAATVEAATGDSLTVTAINAVGESPQSDPVVVPPPMVWIQKSTDLVTWTNVVQIPYEEPSQFIRLQLPPN